MKTMLDKCAVAGDITQAIDRRGAWTCAIVIAGGTELTAVKLQSCDTADGSFSDFKTLIPASEAEPDQYKGFVIDLDGAKKFIKVTGATMATCVLGDCNVDVKQVAIKAGEIPSGADLENNKTATIDVSTYTEPVEIEPTEGKDGMKKATVTLSNIPSGGSATAYAWAKTVGEEGQGVMYFNFDKAPADLTELNQKKILVVNIDNRTLHTKLVVAYPLLISEMSVESYTKTDDNSMEFMGASFTRQSYKDFTMW